MYLKIFNLNTNNIIFLSLKLFIHVNYGYKMKIFLKKRPQTSGAPRVDVTNTHNPK